MLKIEAVEGDPGRLRLAGEVLGPWLDELRRVADAALRSGTSLTLDLSDVTFVDLAGGALLAELTRRDVRLVKCSSFVTELLRVRG